MVLLFSGGVLVSKQVAQQSIPRDQRDNALEAENFLPYPRPAGKTSSWATIVSSMKQNFLILFFLIVIMSSCSKPYFGNSNVEDYLIYVVDNYPPGQGQLVFYDPDTEQHIPILPEFEIFAISISTNNRLAFSSSAQGDSNIYVVDYPFINNTPVNITQESTWSDYPIAWSADGKYLALQSVEGLEGRLQIWDGKKLSEIYQFKNFISEVTWGPDYQLAFTQFASNGDPSEIFIWDGSQVVSVSQNPGGVDRFPNWNEKGQLAFLSERGGEYDIFVWDGLSKKAGIPDVRSFMNVAPDLTGYMSQPEWNHANTLTFTGNAPSESVQIYEWDAQRTHNISQNPEFHNGGQKWRSDGYWSFTTFFSSEQLLYIRDEENQTVLSTNGQYPSAWSQRGYLMFCSKAPSGWTLSMWNGKSVIEVISGSIITAEWQNGTGVSCTSG